ncbi:MAG: hypothetical protein ACI88H_001331 [Cocleimonas sp.]|jgi:hypothetical protein
MNSVSKISGIALASAAATLLLAGCSAGSSGKTAAPATAKQVANVKCSGINSCKGTSACATATSSCKGQNSCKGQGWVAATATDCTAKGGTASGKV